MTDGTETMSRRGVIRTAAATAAAVGTAVGAVSRPGVARAATTVSLPYTVIDNPADLESGFATWLANRNANGFPKSILKLAFTNANAAPLNPLVPASFAGAQIQGARIEGIAKRGTGINWDDPVNPLMTFNGKLRNWLFKDITFNSTVAGAKGLLFNSNVSAPGSNQDGKFERVEFMGPWDYGIAFDGQATANLNSEVVFEQFACGNSASFVRGLVVVGLSGDDMQEEQFLNYSFRDCKFEGSHGSYVVFNKGGSVTFEGFNSWIHTGSQNGGVPKGIMLYMPVTQHFDSVQYLSASHMRVEIRGPESKFMDCGWTSSARLEMLTLDTASNAFKFKPGGSIGTGSPEDITLRGGAQLVLHGPSLGGYIGLRDKGGKVHFPTPPVLKGTQTAGYTTGTGTGLVRNFVPTTSTQPPAPTVAVVEPY